MKDLKTSDFDEFRDLFETKYLFLTGQELKPNQDLFDLNEIFRFEIEAAIKGERDPIEILKECWGYSSFEVKYYELAVGRVFGQHCH